MAVAARFGITLLVFVAWLFGSLVAYGFAWLCLHGVWIQSDIADVIAWNVCWMLMVFTCYDHRDDYSEIELAALWRPWIIIVVQVGLLTVYAVKGGLCLVFVPGAMY